MRFKLTVVVLTVCLLAAGCHSYSTLEQPARLPAEAVFGSSFESVSFTADSNRISIQYDSIPEAGSFIRFHSTDRLRIDSQQWQTNSDTLHLIVATKEFIDVGIVQLPGYVASKASVEVGLRPAGKVSSAPPTGEDNQVQFFTAYQADAQRVFPKEVRLEWAEVNTGDYNFDGEVNLADLQQIALHYGETVLTGDPEMLRRTAYWVDGDRNSEINAADIQPIALNYLNTIDGYVVYRDGSSLHHPDGSTATIKRSEAAIRNSPINPLPPYYSVLLDGQVENDWKLAPVDAESVEGAISTAEPERINDFEADGSLVISGVELYSLLENALGTYDSGYSIMRIIDPGDEIDGIEIGDIIEGDNGLFSLVDVPRDTQLALEISYAPVLNLMTGAAFDQNDPDRNRELAIANRVITRFPFVLPASATSLSMSPRIDLLLRTPGQQSSGYFIDLSVNTSWDSGSISYLSRLDYVTGIVAANPIGDTDFVKRPWLTDSDFDNISDAYLGRINDFDAHIGLTSKQIRYSGTVSSFNESTGVMVIADPFDMDIGMFAPVDEIQFNFTEYVWFTDEVLPNFFTPAGLLDSSVEVVGTRLNGAPGGPDLSYWATTVNRTSL